MAYENHNGAQRDKLCLYDALAKDFMRVPIGETVRLTVTAILKTASIQPPEHSEEDEMPCVEFEVLEVDGGKKAYSDMSAGEMEEEIYNVKSEEQPEPYREQPSTIPNREDGGSIWTDIKRQDKVSRKPTGRVRPFGYR